MSTYYCLYIIVSLVILSVRSSPDIAASQIDILSLGTSFRPANAIEFLGNSTENGILNCARMCNVNIQCRTFVYDSSSQQCSLYEGETWTGTVVFSNSSTSQVGSLQYFPELYQCYNKTNSECPFGRYLVSDTTSNRGVCPINTYWNGYMCLNQLYAGQSCTTAQSCRTDLNLACRNISTLVCTGAFGVNLIVNGDAETGPCSLNTTSVSPSFWYCNGSITQQSYLNSNPTLTPYTPGPSNPGNCYFVGNTDPLTSMFQMISMTNYQFLVSHGRISYNFSAWMGGFLYQGDHPVIWTEFYDSNGSILNTVTLPIVTNVERMNTTELLYREVVGSLPNATSSVKVVVEMVQVVGWNDGSADNISLQLDFTP